tara:strand:- start:612 stop:1487 length:876 start_codon:yes stop_codon:yes gene_type:complete
MKYINKKRNLENYTVRNIPKSVLKKNSEGKTVIDTDSPKYYYGTIPNFKIDNEGNFILNNSGQKIVNTIDVNIYLTQNLDDMGIFTDKEYTPKDTLLTEKPNNFNSFSYGRLAGAPLNFYYSNTLQVTGNTDDSLLRQVKSYRKNSNGEDIYVPNLNTSNNPKEEFSGVLSENSERIIYKISANINNITTTGIEYTTYKKLITKTIDDFGFNRSYNRTVFKVLNSGWNTYNTSLNASIKKEEYLGVVFKPEVDSVVFINRGVADIFERHSLLSEIKTTNDIDTNRGGFIRI